MKFSIVQSISGEADLKTKVIESFPEKINQCISGIDYGDDLKRILVGLICVEPKFDPFFKVSKPKYVKNRKVVKVEEIEIEIEKELSYDLKLDYHSFVFSDDVKSANILQKELLDSFSVFEAVKIKNFDKERFIHDVTKCLLDQPNFNM